MKSLCNTLFFFGLFFNVHQCALAQDAYIKFETRLSEPKRRTIQESVSVKHKKNNKISKVANGYTVDYSSIFFENSSFAVDSIPKRRSAKSSRELIEDSTLIPISNSNDIYKLKSDSIRVKKKKKKNEEQFFEPDSVQIDSLIQDEFVDETRSMSLSDSMRLQPQKVFIDSAYVCLMENKFIQSILYCDKVIGEYPSTEEFKFAFLWRAKAKIGLNDLVNALIDLDVFISLDNCKSNLCGESFYQLGIVNFKLQNYQNAASAFSKVLTDSTFPNIKYCFFYRAFCVGELGQYINAVQDYTRFLNLDKFKSVSSAEALYFRGFYKVKLDDNRGAISDYNLAIDMYSAAYENSKNKNTGYFQKLIDTYITRGLAYAEIKKWDDAIDSYNIVIKMKPDYATAFYLKGLSEIGKGDLDAGCLHLSRAGELGSIDAYNDIKIHCK